MKKYCMLLGLICAFVFANAQINLVRNPSFENYSVCPVIYDQLKYALFWQSIDSIGTFPDAPLCTPEYCNACSGVNDFVGIPDNFHFSHYPRTGNGLVMMETYFDGTYAEHYQRDYVQGHLFKPLVAGSSYCVTFYVTLCQLSQYAINHLGAYLDDGSMDAGQDSAGCASPQTAFIPQIVEDSIINDTTNWVKVQGSFTATGTERFITIGNFFDLHHTDTARRNLSHVPWNTGNQFSWYVLDDVSVIAADDTANAGSDQAIPYGSTDSVQIGDTTGYLPCYWYKNGLLIDSNKAGFKVHPDTTTKYVMQLDVCGHITTDTVVVHVGRAGIHDPSEQLKFVTIYPNPTTNYITVKGAEGCAVVITDIIGRIIGKYPIQQNSQVLNIEESQAGTYVVEIQSIETGQRIFQRIVKE